MSLFRSSFSSPLDFYPFSGFLHDVDARQDNQVSRDSSRSHALGLWKPDFMTGPRVDVHEHSDRFSLIAEVPGVKKPDVAVNVDDRTKKITISGNIRSEYHSGDKGGEAVTAGDGASKSTEVSKATNDDGKVVSKAQSRPIVSERCFGSFSRSFVLPETADLGHIKARFQDGLLKVDVPKRVEEKHRSRAVTIEDANE